MSWGLVYNFFLGNLWDLNLSVHTNDSELQLDFLFRFMTESLLFEIGGVVQR